MITMEALNVFNRKCLLCIVFILLTQHPTGINSSFDIKNITTENTNDINLTYSQVTENTLNKILENTIIFINKNNTEINSDQFVKSNDLNNLESTINIPEHSNYTNEVSIQNTLNEYEDINSTEEMVTEDYTTQKTQQETVEQFTVPTASYSHEIDSVEINEQSLESDTLSQVLDELHGSPDHWTTENINDDSQKTFQDENNSEKINITNNEPLQDDTTTKDFQRTSKHSQILNEDDGKTTFQFWTTLSSDIKKENFIHQTKDQIKNDVNVFPNDVQLIRFNIPIVGHIVTMPTVNINLNNIKTIFNDTSSKITIKNDFKLNDSLENKNITVDLVPESQPSVNVNISSYEQETELSLEQPSPDNELAKNGEDFEIETEESTQISTTTNLLYSNGSESYTKHLMKNETQLDMDFLEAADYGMKKMIELYGVQEPKLYYMGMWLEPDNPARFVATFNGQSEEAKKLARFGYASLQATVYLNQRFPEELESRVSAEEDDDSEEEKREEGDVKISQIRPLRPKPPRNSALRQQCPLKNNPRCPPASKRYRTHDGTCNNARHPRWGSAPSAVQRFLPPEYSDGLQDVRRAKSGSPLPTSRAVSAAVHSAGGSSSSSASAPVTHMLMQWGQFLDHDITAASQSRGFNGSVPRCCAKGGREFVPRELLHPECLPIAVHEDDPFYGPRGIRCLEFVRSSPAPRTGCELGHREQLNQVTAYIDASPIYSSSVRQADKLRLFRNGLLQYGRLQGRRPLLPQEVRDEEALCQKGAVDASCFKAGDGRVNEHPGLVAMHIVWLRRHNRLATEMSHLNPHWSDEKVYHETRKIIGAFVQHITYREFLPIVLGSEVMRLFDLELTKKGYYNGYSSKINPNPANSFGAAAFRFGHSLVQDSFIRYDQFHRPIFNNVSLHEELTNPSNIWSAGAVDRLLLGMTNQPSQKRDEFLSPELTNHLFQTSRFSFGMDLASINIQRGRDHGIPSYVQWREPCGLTAVSEWSDLLKIMPLRSVRRMEEVYRDVEDIDLFTGGMAERPVIGGLVGPTFACIIAQQFSILRRGDRFWYENGGFESSFTPAQIQQIKKITLAQVLCQTMENVETLQPFVFLISDNFRNKRVSCDDHFLNNFDLTPWTENDFDNNINTFEKTVTPKTITKQTQISQQSLDDLLPFIFSKTSNNTTPRPKLTKSPKPIIIDDKLDINDKPNSNHKPTNGGLTSKIKTTTKLNLHIAQQTTKPSIILDDKLDFFSKNIIINNILLKKNIINNLQNDEIMHKTDDIMTDETNNTLSRSFIKDKQSLLRKDNNNVSSLRQNMTDNQDNLKTFSLKDDFPFLHDFINHLTTTYRPLSPIMIPQHIQNDQTTIKPDLFTYLINIIPKTTTPRLPHRETIKITIQDHPAYAKPLNNKRPIYNNNRLEYRPTSNNEQNYNIPLYQTPKPLMTQNGNIDRYDLNQNSYNRPKPVYSRPNNPYSDDFTTEYNPYSLITFSHIETTTKRQDLFDRPDLNYNTYENHQNSHKRPSTSTADYNINPSYSRPQNIKPASTGISIYVDTQKPSQNIHNHNTGYLSSEEVEEENTPLFTRPNYHRPFLQKPLENYSPEYPKPQFDYSGQNSFQNENIQSEHGHFTQWTPDSDKDPPVDPVDNDYDNTYSIRHKEKPSTNRKPTEHLQRPKPQVNLNLPSQHGVHHHNDISIIINPNINYKSKENYFPNLNDRHFSTTTNKPAKYYYVGNILYKYPDSKRTNEQNNMKNSELPNHKIEHQILRENYNNAWTPDTNEHKLFNNNEDNTESMCGKNTKNCNDYISSSTKTYTEMILKSSNINKNSKNQAPEIKHTSISPRESFVNLPSNKVKSQVFFDVIPSENSPLKWVYYNERPEDNQHHAHLLMPSLKTDPLSSKEIPHPISFTKRRKSPQKSNLKT